MRIIKKILIVDADVHIHKILAYRLSILGYLSLHATDGEEAIVIFKEQLPDLIILDIMISKIDGFGVCQQIRQLSSVPIIILTGLASLADKIAGLEIGADDYIVKPFAIKELEARIKAILRRCSYATMNKLDSVDDIICIGEFILDFNKRHIYKNHQKIQLTNIEFCLLELLMRNAGQPISRSIILQEVWGYGSTKFLPTRVVDVHIYNIRSKLETNIRNPEYILTIRNMGYLFQKPF
uniref:regulatory component of sensory transduction system n=1 Tax=Dixoniella grisea TaxID=35153 RepID=UPI001FCD8CD4|nr:regulatory component of sensory transduction system [Dixoniella grisea]UNJ17220.1 regulatory component of sensory transduction system [Dixoniella grisea]